MALANQLLVEVRQLTAKAETLVTIADVEKLFVTKIRKYGSKNKFLASAEYKRLYPMIAAIYAAAKKDYTIKATQAMADMGVAPGDTVSYVAPGFDGGEVVSGVVVMRKKIPWVKLAQAMMTPKGMRKQVKWHRGWRFSN